VPLWFTWDQHKLYVVGRERAVWIAYIRREPRVGVLVDEEARRHRRVQMPATATVVKGPVLRAQSSPRWRALDRLLGRSATRVSSEPLPACMHKMLTILNAIVKRQSCWSVSADAVG
jgi:hypothetical protein